MHLSEEGYAWMGNHIADALVPFIVGDTTRLEEEEEHPKDISRGYVVVRRDDLD